MAERRMFSRSVVETDGFYELPAAAQALYLHLAMNADDDGFVGSPIMIQKMTGAKPKDTDLLKKKGFIIPFDTGVIVIAHWRVNNELRKDRCKETIYQNEKIHLRITKTKAYEYVSEPVQELDTDCIQNVSKMDTDCIQNVSKMETDWQPNGNQIGDKLETQCSIGKCSVVESSVDEVRIDKDRVGKGSCSSSVVEVIDDYDDDKAIILYKANIDCNPPPMAETSIRSLVKKYGYATFEKAVKKAVNGGKDKMNMAYIISVTMGIAEDGDYDDRPKMKSNIPFSETINALLAETENNYLETGGENEN